MRYYLLLLTCVSLSAQSVEKSVISTIGNSYKDLKIAYSKEEKRSMLEHKDYYRNGPFQFALGWWLKR